MPETEEIIEDVEIKEEKPLDEKKENLDENLDEKEERSKPLTKEQLKEK